MRRIINISALVFFAWLVVSSFDIPNNLLYFLLVGELPGTNVRLSPTTMLALMTLLIGVVVFEICARRIEIVRHLRRQVFGIMSRREQLPRRRFTRI